MEKTVRILEQSALSTRKNYFYRVQCSMVVRDWLSRETGEQMQATTIYVDKISMA